MQFLANNPFILLTLVCCLVPALSFGAGVFVTQTYHKRGRPVIYWTKQGGNDEEL